MTIDRLHRTRHHGQPDGRAPGQGRPRRGRLQPHAAKTQPLVDAGGRAAASVAEAVSGAEVVAVMVPDSPDVRDVLAGSSGGVFDARASPAR